jgi:hypothetical protein
MRQLEFILLDFKSLRDAEYKQALIKSANRCNRVESLKIHREDINYNKSFKGKDWNEV